MTMLKLDPTTGKLARENGSFVRIGGVEEIAQHTRFRMRLVQGEVPWNLALGMRYVGVILAKGTPAERIEGEFISAATGTPGVLTVDNLVLEPVDTSLRTARITWSGTISTDDLATRIPFHDTFTLAA